MIKVDKVSVDWGEEILQGLTWYIIGPPKTGKTTAISKWSAKGTDGVILIDTDLGSNFVDGLNRVIVTSLFPPKKAKMTSDGKHLTVNGTPQYDGVVEPIDRGFKKHGKAIEAYSVIEVLTWLENEWDELPYDTIALDTIDKLNEWIEKTVIEELKIKAMGEGDWGADWSRAKQMMGKIIDRLQVLVKQKGANVVLTSHSKQTVVTDGKTQLAPELPRGMASMVLARADAIGYTTVNKKDNEYLISFESYDERAVGSRLTPIAQKSLPFSYEAIVDEINKYKEKS